ncbi:MAG: glycosyltransferase [Phycisphaerales bacterium]|nr:glycosyltransferase [Phycisphaerales bacterium]
MQWVSDWNPGAVAVFGVVMASSMGCLVYWSVALGRVLRSLRTLPTARAGLSLPAPQRRVCLIVPAHNEERALPRLAESLKRQDYKTARFVLVLDRCTDGTGEAVRRVVGDDDRFEIIELGECPPAWAGKVNAAWQGVLQSRAAREAEVLVFTDADCELDPGCLRACVALLEDRRLDLLSLLSTLRMEKWFELLCQPAATLELLRHNPLERANRNDEQHRAFANGQFLMFRAEAYHRAGGHPTVREALLEDIALAKRMAHGPERFRTGLLVADGMVRCSMYDTWTQFRSGWRRIYIEACGRKSKRLVGNAWKARGVGTVLPLGAAVGLLTSIGDPSLDVGWRLGVGIVSGSALSVWLAALWLLARAGGAAGWTVLLHAIGTWLVGGILIEGARDLRERRPTRWGGREYVLEDRS